jgi:diguanylate cyclase (GGDEF)-like protein
VLRFGFITLLVSGCLLISSALMPGVLPADPDRVAEPEALLSAEIDVLKHLATGTGPRLQRSALAERVARMRGYADALGDATLTDFVAAMPTDANGPRTELVVAVSHVAARFAAVRSARAIERERSRADRESRAAAVLFWPGIALMVVGFGATYSGTRRVVAERKRLDAQLPATDESLEMRAIRLVESHAAAHERLIERSRERRDLLAEKQMLEDFKLYDPLTRLMRDDACIERAVPLVGEYLYRRVSYFVALMDLDLFKRVNDTYGHAAGDEALRHFAQALTSVAGAEILVSRQHSGGDEFVAIGTGGDSEVQAFHERLKARLRTNPLRIEGIAESFVIGASTGYTLPTEEVLGGLRGNDTPRGRVVHLLKQLKHCDNALYLAKRSGRGSIRRYEPGLAETTQENPGLGALGRIERHIRTDFPHLPTDRQTPIVNALERAADAMETALRASRDGDGHEVAPNEERAQCASAATDRSDCARDGT